MDTPASVQLCPYPTYEAPKTREEAPHSRATTLTKSFMTNNMSAIQPTQPQDKPLSRILEFIPQLLVMIRFCLSPFLLLDALDGQTSFWFITGFVIAFLSDIFDGVIARRLGVSNAMLRKADSWADVCLYLCIATSAWLVHPKIVIAFQMPLSMVVLIQLLWWIVNLAKYGQPASYHTYSAKLWGLTLFVATVALFGCGYGGWTLWLAIIVGIIHTAEEIVMTLILPNWTHDVLSLVHARRLQTAESEAFHGRKPYENR